MNLQEKSKEIIARIKNCIPETEPTDHWERQYGLSRYEQQMFTLLTTKTSDEITHIIEQLHRGLENFLQKWKEYNRIFFPQLRTQLMFREKSREMDMRINEVIGVAELSGVFLFRMGEFLESFRHQMYGDYLGEHVLDGFERFLHCHITMYDEVLKIVQKRELEEWNKNHKEWTKNYDKKSKEHKRALNEMTRRFKSWKGKRETEKSIKYRGGKTKKFRKNRQK